MLIGLVYVLWVSASILHSLEQVNNRLITKLMLMWRREEKIEMRACFHANTKLGMKTYALVG
jgi:hypothetical protein